MNDAPLETAADTPAPGPDDASRAPRGTRSDTADIAKYADEFRALADEMVALGDRGEARLLLRSVKELIDSFKALRPWRGKRKIVAFGSARTGPETDVYKLAVDFGRKAADRGYMVITGAGPGVMEAAHVGSGREMSIGFNIYLPFEQAANAVIEGDPKLLTFNYFFTRKLMFLKEADALVLFPGGFGTLDETFEALTLIQTGKSPIIPVVMVDPPGGQYWDHWLRYMFEELHVPGLISEEDFNFFRITKSVGEAMREIEDFYRVYHSQRYVGKDLVLRLHKPIDDALLSHLRSEFKTLLVGGEMRTGGPHPHEANEPETHQLHRLFIRFNRRSTGRLRALIDHINREA
jgi:hypothetical protein